MTTTAQRVPSVQLILRTMARELTIQATHIAREFYLSDPAEYTEFAAIPEPILMQDTLDDDLPVGYVPAAMTEALRISADIRLLREVEKWEEKTDGDAEDFARRLVRQAMGVAGGLFEGIFAPSARYRLPRIPFSTFNPWDANLMSWLRSSVV